MRWLLALLVLAGTGGGETLEGSVTNGTTGASLPADLKVTVVTLDGQDEVSRQEIAVTSDGKFQVDVPERATKVIAATVHSGVSYSATSDLKGGAIELKIFETTIDLQAISIESDTITLIRAKDPSFLEVLHLLQLRNGGDRTVVSPLRLPRIRRSVDFAPADALNRYGLVPDGVDGKVTAPLPPGDHTISYVYRVPQEGGMWQLDRNVFNMTARFDILVGDRLTFAGPGFKFAESKQLGDTTYQRYRSGAQDANSILQGFLSPPPPQSRSGLWSGVAAAGAVLVFALLRQRFRPRARTRQELVNAIAVLDEGAESGLISKQEHARRRDALLRKIK